jgi:hypothetical protein
MNHAGVGQPELEHLYAGPLGPLPTGATVGTFVGFLDSPGGRNVWNRATHTVLFRWPAWGVDFEHRTWWCLRPGMRWARFTATVGPSRWRDAEVFRLEYSESRSSWIRRTLYDELKPLPDGRVIGIGGVNKDRGRGDHFWFELQASQRA